MTYKNRKKLYDHYVKVGNTEKAEVIAKGHPDVLEVPVEEKPKTNSKKGKKGVK